MPFVYSEAPSIEYKEPVPAPPPPPPPPPPPSAVNSKEPQARPLRFGNIGRMREQEEKQRIAKLLAPRTTPPTAKFQTPGKPLPAIPESNETNNSAAPPNGYNTYSPYVPNAPYVTRPSPPSLFTPSPYVKSSPNVLYKGGRRKTKRRKRKSRRI
jgi:hypothetical protein